jgi:predicted GH43/DUF377 family glycosyl hydrolase
MNRASFQVTRTTAALRPNQSRVLLRPFYPGDSERAGRIIMRVMALAEDLIAPLLEELTSDFSSRHDDIETAFLQRFEQVRPLLPADAKPSAKRKLLIGSYFLSEFSLESAALFNPSIVPHPDQSNLPAHSLRFVMSLRATGEGHLSSLTFRTGIINGGHRIELFAPGSYLSEPGQVPNPVYDNALFARKLHELGLTNEFTDRVMQRLGGSFNPEDLRSAVEAERNQPHPPEGEKDRQNTADGIWILAKSNYEVQFRPEQELSERILFPSSPSQRNGIEDCRFVCFQNPDGTRVYYATFTAFDGKLVVPELIETPDFLHFRFITLNGPAARNKGMALFPRKVNGRYAMLSRQDNENIYLVYSDNVHFWYEPRLLIKPAYPWETVQLGNCGSPIETEAGWLVLSHGVGPMRKYCIGAFLLDRDDPSKVIGRLPEPLLKPTPEEREGYVPNVVYTCGALVHRRKLIIPYGFADYATSFAIVPLDDVLAGMR